MLSCPVLGSDRRNYSARSVGNLSRDIKMQITYDPLGLPIDPAWRLIAACFPFVGGVWLLWAWQRMRAGAFSEGQYQAGKFVIATTAFYLISRCAWPVIVGLTSSMLVGFYLFGLIAREKYLPRVKAIDLHGHKVALVLMGGGAKGAYEVGVWKALWELGIRNFVSIAGTSVGALTGYMIANAEPPDVEQVWHRVVASHILRRGASHWLKVGTILLGEILVFSPWLGSLAAMLYFRGNTSLYSALIFIVLGNVLYLHFFILKHLATRGWIYPFFKLEPRDGMAMGIYIALLGASIGFMTKQASASLLWVVPVIFGLSALWLLPVLLGRRLLALSLKEGLYPRAELNREISKLAKNPSFKHCAGPVWATIGRFSRYINPFEVGLEEKWPPVFPEARWTPFYVDLKKGDISSTLRSTSAVPFVFKAEKYQGDLVVDGGICDNWPLTPALLERPDYVIAIGVNRGDWVAPNIDLQWRIEKNWTQYFFAHRIKDQSVVNNIRSELVRMCKQREGDYWNLLPEAPPLRNLRQTKFIWISPSMWTFIGIPTLQQRTGTLRFSEKYVKKLIAEGYRDTMDLLRQR